MIRGRTSFCTIYESFDSVFMEFISRAADDPQVLAISRRFTERAVIADHQGPRRAAENGKQVTAIASLKARFDEESNIQWCAHLEQAACTWCTGSSA